MSLEELLVFVERAVRGDRKLLVQLFRTLQQLAHHPDAPPEERALGEVLSRILMGDREPNLHALPPEMADEVNGLLERLRGLNSADQVV